MRYSSFSPFGMFAFSGQEPQAKRIYLSLVSGFKKESSFDTTPGAQNYQEAKLYAMAMGLARVASAQKRGNQTNPLKMVEKLPSAERDYSVIPSARDTLLDRQRAVALRKMLIKGPAQGAIAAALQILLGSEFVAYRARLPSERVTYPASNPETVGTYARPENQLKVFQLLEPIVTLGVPLTVKFAYVAGYVPPLPNEKFTFEPDNNVVAESVTVTSVARTGTTFPNGDVALVPLIDQMTAVFTKAHTNGALIQNGPCPVYSSNQREVMIVLKASAARDAEKRRRVNDLMRRAVRATTRWEIIEESSAAHTGPFIVGTSKVGTTAVGSVAFAF